MAERGAQQGLRLCLRQAARAQVEQRVGIELADGRAVRGLHFIGVDHQRRLGVDLGIGRQQQVLVGQVRIGAVGAFADLDATMEHHAAAVGGNATPQQLATRIARDVVDAQAGLDVASAIAEQHAVGGQLGVVAFQAHVQFVAAECCAQFQVDAVVLRVAGQHRVGTQEAGLARAAGLHAGVLEHGIAGYMGVQHGVVQVRRIADAEAVLDHAQAGAGTQFDQVAVVPGQVGIAGDAGEHQLQRRFHLHAFVHAQHHAFIGQRGIQASEDLFAALVAAAKETHGVFAGGQCGRQRLQLHAVRQDLHVAQRGIQAAVDEHQARCRDVLQQRGVQRRALQRCRRERTAFQLAQRGVLPGFVARGRQAVTQGRVQHFAARVAAAEGLGHGVEQGAHQTAASRTTRSLRKS